MSDAVIIIGRQDMPEEITAELARYWIAMDSPTPQVLLHGVIAADENTVWVGLEPVTALVNLKAPEPVEGDFPGTWLHFENSEVVANTSDLVAVRFQR